MNTDQITATDTNYAGEFRDASAVAQATPCNVQGCDGFMHEANLEPEKWAHSLADEYFDDKIITIGTWTVDSKNYVADVDFEGTGTYSAADLREAADRYEAFPALLRSAAARLDTLNRRDLTVNDIEARATALNVDPASLLFDALNK